MDVGEWEDGVGTGRSRQTADNSDRLRNRAWEERRTERDTKRETGAEFQGKLATLHFVE